MSDLKQEFLNDLMERINTPGGKCTKEEAEFAVKAIARTCKGPVKLGKEAEYAELREKAGNFGNPDTHGSIAMLDAVNRDYCGYDFNSVILAYPLDGQEHLVNCPKCGLEISFRSPFFPISS